MATLGHKITGMLAVLFAVVLSLALAPSFALAEGENTTEGKSDPFIEVAKDDHTTYNIYQIFTCVFEESTQEGAEQGEAKYLAKNTSWGQNVKDADVLEGTRANPDVLKAINSVEVTTDRALLDILEEHIDLESTPYAVITGDPKLLNAEGSQYVNRIQVPTGYYLIVSADESGKNGAVTLHLAKRVIKDTLVVDPKVDTVTSNKKIKDVNDSVAKSTTVWQDSADYDIGDSVPFKLTAILGSMYEDYKAFSLTFHDLMAAGISNPREFVVKIDGKPLPKDKGYYTETLYQGINTATVNQGNTTVKVSKDDKTVKGSTATHKCSFEIKIDLKKIPESVVKIGNNSEITVEYIATLNEKANIGAAGNENISWVTYTNNPNSDKPGENGETARDKVKVFTYLVYIDKVRLQGDDQIDLTGAQFTLEKLLSDGKKKTVAVLEYYKDGVDERGNTNWVLVERDEDGNIIGKTVEDSETAIINEPTRFVFKGIDDGTYILTETKVPDGYTAIEPIQFEVTASHDLKSDDPQLTELSGTFLTGENIADPLLVLGAANKTMIDDNETGVLIPTTDKDGKLTGNLGASIVNNDGTLLPTTGGIGTTIFRVIGGILVVGAIVALVLRRRRSSE